MFVQRHAGKVDTWFVVFSGGHTDSHLTYWTPGKFKHVAAFGYSAEAQTWLFIDPDRRGAEFLLVPTHEGEGYIAKFVSDATVLRIAARKNGCTFRILLCCTSVVRALIGLPGWGILSLIPDRLYRDCIDAGAVVVGEPAPCLERPNALA